ncbi:MULTISPECIES: DUF896 domain-containing protein [Sutcliffiella]|uniref:UPF0291 protein BC6307_12145 n=1 Tax=Sutcliffiella cohnii TaxID=33932 RepID=A0A223KR50_9BACI|nr:MULTISPECIES: DUF896 domain-containing protein [Sutcliffiella]AST91970.1 hypothetical protein BC6307_12145 [Sutcliffiella cohnii]MED4015250.1 DUF896 domain-containing protein [Sutcliffiella cohnii]WBL13212.1 DUF896 domain-containing protein [Sutcliffiella sp. NC1]
MLSQDKMKRINLLAKKAKSEGLTEEEAKEQKELRAEYVKTFRSSMVDTLKSVTIVDPNGNDVTPQKLKDEQNKKFH